MDTTLTIGLPALAMMNELPWLASRISCDRCVLASWMLTVLGLLLLLLLVLSAFMAGYRVS